MINSMLKFSTTGNTVSKKWFIIAVTFFLLLILAPDFIHWALYSHFQEPVRSDLGSYTHYLVWVHDIFQERFSDNPYFWEHSGGTERFLLFQSIARLIPNAIRIPMGWWYDILKGISTLVLFTELYLLLKNFGLERQKSLGLTTFFFFFYGPFALLDPGPYSWFLAFFLAGILLLFRSPGFSKLWQQVVCIGVANILFTVHPIYFSLGILIGGIWLLWFSIFERNWRRWMLLGLWVLLSLLNAIVFYGAQIFSVSRAGYIHESIALMGVRFNHLPNLPLSSLRIAFVFITLAVLTYMMFKKSSGESHSFQVPLFLSISFLSIFLAMNSNIITGFSVIPDHDLLPEDFFAVILLGLVLFGPLPEIARSRRIRWFAAAFSIILGLTVIMFFYGRPWRSWLVVGGKIPLITAYIFLIWRLWGTSIPIFIIKKFVLISIIGAVAFGLLFSWRLRAHDYSSYRKADEPNRAVATALRSLDPGVVLAPPDLADIIVLYTNHKVYWADSAFNFSGNDTEFKKRWLDAMRFYPQSAELAGESCLNIVGGAGRSGPIPIQLYSFEQDIIRIFFPSWYNSLVVIPNSKIGAACAELLQESKRTPLTEAWQPAYRIDYTIFEKDKDTIPSAIKQDFIFLKNAGEFLIYKFR